MKIGRFMTAIVALVFACSFFVANTSAQAQDEYIPRDTVVVYCDNGVTGEAISGPNWPNFAPFFEDRTGPYVNWAMAPAGITEGPCALATEPPATEVPTEVAGFWSISSATITCDGAVGVTVANPEFIEEGQAISINIYIGDSLVAGTTVPATPGVANYSAIFDTSGWFAGYDVKAMVSRAGSTTPGAEVFLDTSCGVTPPPATEVPTEVPTELPVEETPEPPVAETPAPPVDEPATEYEEVAEVPAEAPVGDVTVSSLPSTGSGHEGGIASESSLLLMLGTAVTAVLALAGISTVRHKHN